MEILNPQILSGTSPCFSPKKHRYKYHIAKEIPRFQPIIYHYITAGISRFLHILVDPRLAIAGTR